MAGTTPKRLLRYPSGSDSPDVPRDVWNVVTDLESEVNYLAVRNVLEVGLLGQTRAGRILTAADFTDMGLHNPVEFWNLGDTVGGFAGLNLTNKGAIPFGSGILGTATEAAIFAGSTAQALYRADAGAGDPFRIRHGSWGCWFKTARKATVQYLMSKWAIGSVRCWAVYIDSGVVVANVSPDGLSIYAAYGSTPVDDDKWHYAVITHDGTSLRVYVDGQLEGIGAAPSAIFQGSGPLNIGSYGADASTAAGSPHFGRVDTAFVHNDVLSADQVRQLYSQRVTHGNYNPPRRANLTVVRRRRGAPLVAADFSTQPLRLHGLADLNDLGSNNLALTANGGVAAGTSPGADGEYINATQFDGVDDYLSSSDAGLPTSTVRSLGCWFKGDRAGVAECLMSYGTPAAESGIYLGAVSGDLSYIDPGVKAIVPGVIRDGEWHFVVAVINPAATDGVIHKVYVDGRCAGNSTVAIVNTVLGGAGAFRLGRRTGTNTDYFRGSIDSAFVTGYALSSTEIQTLYAKASQAMIRSPKWIGDHLESLGPTYMGFVADDLEPQDQVYLDVSS